MNITSAKYTKSRQGNIKNIKATIDGVVSDVPMNPENRHYAEIQKQVAAGELTIEDAD